MKKGKLKQGVTDDEISCLLGEVARGTPSPGVDKLTGKDIKLTATSDEGSMFFVSAKSPGLLRVGAVLHLPDATAGLLHLFEKMAASLGIPADERRAYATDRTRLVLNIMLDRVAQSLGDALDLLLNESVIIAGHFSKHYETPHDEGLPPLPREALDALTSGALEALKARVNARRPGVVGVSLVRVMTAILEHGGEDSKAKYVARVLGISDRQLRKVRADIGFDSWSEFVGFVMRLAKRN